MNPMQSPNTGVGKKLCPEGRPSTSEMEIRELEAELCEPDEVLKPGKKSGHEAARDFSKIMGIMGVWMR